jgi:hypothetical protein
MFESLRNSVNKAASEINTNFQVGSIKTEQLVIQEQINGLKRAWGLSAYDLYIEG